MRSRLVCADRRSPRRPASGWLAAVWTAWVSLPGPSGVAAGGSQAGRTPGAADASVLRLDEVVDEALRNNPALKAARSQGEVLGARVPQALAWPDLRFGFDLRRLDTGRVEALQAHADVGLTLAQTVPLSGKNRAQGRAAGADAEAARVEVRRLELDLKTRARTAYFRYANAQAQLEVNRKNEQRLLEFIELTRGVPRAGDRSQAAELAAQTELGRLLEARTDIERQISDEQSALNVLMGRPAHAPLPPPVASAFKPVVRLSPFLPPPSPHAGDERQFALDWPVFQQGMQTLALQHNLELEGMKKRLEAARARYALARREWIPDPDVYVEVWHHEGSGPLVSEYGAGVSFSLPWLNRAKYVAVVEEARQSLSAAKQELVALEVETLGRVRDKLKRIEAMQTHYEFVRDRVLPLAEQTLKAAQTDSAAGRGTYLEVLSALRTAREVESLLHEHLAEYLSSVAELDALVGGGQVTA